MALRSPTGRQRALCAYSGAKSPPDVLPGAKLGPVRPISLINLTINQGVGIYVWFSVLVFCYSHLRGTNTPQKGKQRV
jgi:hypothetical protein